MARNRHSEHQSESGGQCPPYAPRSFVGWALPAGFSETVEKKRCKFFGAPRAFSLVELLVVIGIITLLIGILLPTLGKAREDAKRISCLSNLHQISIAAIHYASTSGTYPASHYVVSNDSGTLTFDWDWCYLPGQQPKPGLLWLGETQMPVNRCPSWEGKQFNYPGAPYCGYNYNVSYIGGEPQFGMPDDPGFIRCLPARAGGVSHPSQAAMFGDAENSVFWCNTYMRSPLPSPSELQWLSFGTSAGGFWAAYNDPAGGGSGRTNGAQGFRHRGSSNVCFADGHAESIRNIIAAPHMPKEVGFLARDNSVYGGE
ncbi:MAG TPA: DUF1559 domain-containing protein [Humisphaera sp.]|jgi:prepilin-type processing-associated H-X9-DG protein/prepilin-type N-terminal cleavage/methylation domain-containing protein|nr:DUF1559 domain-containing protein [Humisphaera sp.]